MLTTARPHAAEQTHVWHFVHVCPFCLGESEDSQALRTCFPHLTPVVLHLTTTHVLNSCEAVKLGSGASGESSVVNGPSPGYPHVWSKQVGQCLPGCAWEQNQATVQVARKQHFRNLPRPG